MQSGKQESILSFNQRALLSFFLVLLIVFIFFFRNLFFQPTLILKNLGESSIDPEIALKNNKPTFMEFYAEWCEVCKEMAPKVSDLKDEYGNEINFVFLNVDNPKWVKYIQNFNVNGIPQVNIFNNNGNLERTLIGKQEEKIIRGVLENLKNGIISKEEIINSDLSIIEKDKNNIISPRSHG